MQNVRNFSIIAHIDHGKSTLADRFLELTGTIPKEKMRPQYLDMMDLEREKGITIKMQPCRMNYVFNSKNYVLNLIDTPGHVDFSYEVSRSLAAVEGAVLLVDATKGIQAQTLANLAEAQKQNLKILPVLNKIDRPEAKIEETKTELANLLKIPKEEIFMISAREGTNVKELLEAVIEKVPSPKGDTEKPLKMLIFDSKFDPFKGVAAFLKVVDGRVKINDKIYLMQSKTAGDAKEVGYFVPKQLAQKELIAGDIGYVATGIKEPGKVRVGDTITRFPIPNVESLPGYKEAKPMIFASVYPENPDDFDLLKDSLNKLKLNDAALTFELESQEALGRGYRCGFLGNLHVEITSERLRREFGLNLVISTPQVLYKIINNKDKERLIFTIGDWPSSPTEVKESMEPWARLEVMIPLNYFGQVSEVLNTIKGNYIKEDYFGLDKVLLVYEVPLREIIVGFYENLKSVSQGYASMNYEIIGFRKANLIRLDILIAGKREDAFSKIVPEEDAFREGKKIVTKLKEFLPSQQFSVSLQAAISGKIIARETIKSYRRDVTAPLYGGDWTRKMKLLEQQKKGKKELKAKGKVRVPPQVFLKMFTQ